MIVYISGAYTGKDRLETKANIYLAEQVAKEIWSKGMACLSPHNNTAMFEIEGVTYEDYIRGDLEMLSRCDAIVMLKGWELSRGACREKEFAKYLGLPIYYYPELPEPRGLLTDKQEAHLMRVKYQFLKRVDSKYVKGQKEHGGNLFDKRTKEFGIEEDIDHFVYDITDLDQAERAVRYLEDSSPEDALSILKYGNPDGKTYTD